MEGMNTSGSRFVASRLYEVCVLYRITNISLVFYFKSFFNILSCLSYCVCVCVSQSAPLPFYSSPELKHEMSEGKKPAV